VKLGKDRSVPTFGWDNEYGSVKIDVESFSATKYLISNGEYLEFMNKGEYEN
jgi:formylglycine-generating enzyme required for sulfatase activity